MHTPQNPVNVLWTSGWDSTYRVADLILVQGRTVRPWYVMDSGRMSTKREWDTMYKMWQAFSAKDPSAGVRLLPSMGILRKRIPENTVITDSYQELAGRSHLGSQYDWLARLAHDRDVTLELSIHKDDKAHGFLEGLTERGEDGVHRIRDDVNMPVFERFRFPLFDMTKLEMQEQARQKGFADIMEMTWFCFTPLIGGKPCGVCNPCKYTREEGLGRRVPDATWARRTQARALNKGWRALNRVVGDSQFGTVAATAS
jgi:hypothetical protein